MDVNCTRPAPRVLCFLAVAIASACLREQRVEHFADHALASARGLADAFELLLNLRRRSAFACVIASKHRPAVQTTALPSQFRVTG